MKIITKVQNGRALHEFAIVVEGLASPRMRKELHRAVIDAGRQVKTKVQKAVTQQMALKPGNYQSYVVKHTRGVPQEKMLAYSIFSQRGGLPIERYNGLRSVKSKAGTEQGGVKSAVWNSPRTFKRSFASGESFFAMRPASAGKAIIAPRILWSTGLKPGQPRDQDGRFMSTGKTYGKVRRLFGPALSKEIPVGDSLEIFYREAPKILDAAVQKRLTKLVRY